MSVLPNNTFANPRSPLYAPVGGGGGDTLQSPVDLIPDSNGNQDLNIVASTGTGEASVLIASEVNGANVGLTLSTALGGNANILMGDTGNLNGCVAVVYPGQVLGGGILRFENAGTQVPAVTIDVVNTAVTIGTPAGSGAATGNSTLVLATPGSEGNATIILNGGATDAIHFSDPTTTGIGVYQDTNTRPGQLDIGNDTANTSVASFNQLTNIINLGNPLNVGATYINTPTTITSSGSRPPVGGIVLQQTGAATSTITQQVANTGALIMGASVANPETMFIRDGAAADSAYIDITAGSGAGNAMRIIGGQDASLSSNGAGSTLLLTSSVLAPGTLSNSAIKLSATPQSGTLRNGGLQLSDPPSSLLSSEGGSWSSYSILAAVGGGYGSPQTLNFSTLPDGAYFVGSGVTAGVTPTAVDANASFAFLLYIRNGAIASGGYSIGTTNTYIVYPSAAGLAAGTLELNFVGGNTSANWRVQAYPINGTIQGMG